MLFIVLTLSIAVGILLAMAIGLFIMTRPKVMEMYFDWVNKMTDKMIEKF